ncbi:MAG: thiamine phosphate synthase, partial [Burkholderiales bacterium]
MSKARISGLYALTPETWDSAGLLLAVRAALGGGARSVQYRNKDGAAELRRAQARALVELCREFHVPLIINDDLTLALEVQADGVHLGRDDASIKQARVA